MDNLDILEDFKEKLELLKQIYNEDLGVYKKLELDKAEKEKEINSMKEQKESLVIKKVLLQDACVEARKNAKDVLEDVSTRGLQAIMGEHLSLVINLKENGTPEADFVIKSNYGDYVVENDPANGDGGGVADIVSFSNFISMNYLAGKSNTAPLLLDEPSKYVSSEHSENVAKYLYEVSKYFKKQVFMITHDKLLANMGDKSYIFKLDNEGKTNVVLL